jgi:hydrogenase maturation protein HypF
VIQRLRLIIRGAVQGVGFRPFVYRLATRSGLNGWVLNSAAGVFVEAEGERDRLEGFLLGIEQEKPPHAYIQSLEHWWLDPVSYGSFEIRKSEDTGGTTVLVLPDIATCPDCLREILDPRDRRYRYPFANCTNCGPRYTIIESLPYDRPGTSMRGFQMCGDCRAEYEAPSDRRFHAQPIACAACGPSLELLDESGRRHAAGEDALEAASRQVEDGRVVAVKGLGGFHLIADARNAVAVRRLRDRKHREEKPLALLYPDLDRIHADCEVSRLEERLLLSPEAPIVLLRRRSGADSVDALVAPGNPNLGIMLPSNPLQHLLARRLGFPVVATSGNLSDEPICIDEIEAVTRLRGIADCFLVHNRPIVRHADDSIVRVVLNRELVLRRARGFAPLPVELAGEVPCLLGVGGHLKNTVALSLGRNVVVSQHIGDLENQESLHTFKQVIGSLKQLFDASPERLVADLHPDYISTRYARLADPETISIQHHFAHVAACMAENRLDEPVLGISWDGTGYGPDGAVWGGEFLISEAAGFRRFAAFRNFRLPGGSKAVREPRRSAIGLLFEILGPALAERDDIAAVRAFSASELRNIVRMLQTGLNSPWTSSAGRLFDAVASLVSLRQVCRFEGQAAMELEFAAEGVSDLQTYPFQFTRGGVPPLREEDLPTSGTSMQRAGMAPAHLLDWQPMIEAILNDIREGMAPAHISERFHRTLAQAIVKVALEAGIEKVVLTGGCFQNKRLTELAVGALEAAALRPYWHQRVPPNDGGISLGQVVAAARLIRHNSAGSGWTGPHLKTR